LYQGRYKSILVDKDAYLNMLSRYIHLNPISIKRMKGRTEEEKIRHLKSYKWSSLPGYIKKRGKQQFVDYSSVLGEYGGDNDKGRRSYKERLFMDISTGSEIKEKIMGQSILGSEEFIDWLWENILKEDRNRRERPALREIQGFKAKRKRVSKVYCYGFTLQGRGNKRGRNWEDHGRGL
jgi:hypothetical protein